MIPCCLFFPTSWRGLIVSTKPQAVILATSANGTHRISEICDASEWEDELCLDQLKCHFHVHVQMQRCYGSWYPIFLNYIWMYSNNINILCFLITFCIYSSQSKRFLPLGCQAGREMARKAAMKLAPHAGPMAATLSSSLCLIQRQARGSGALKRETKSTGKTWTSKKLNV